MSPSHAAQPTPEKKWPWVAEKFIAPVIVALIAASAAGGFAIHTSNEALKEERVRFERQLAQQNDQLHQQLAQQQDQLHQASDIALASQLQQLRDASHRSVDGATEQQYAQFIAEPSHFRNTSDQETEAQNGIADFTSAIKRLATIPQTGLTDLDQPSSEQASRIVNGALAPILGKFESKFTYDLARVDLHGAYIAPRSVLRGRSRGPGGQDPPYFAAADLRLVTAPGVNLHGIVLSGSVLTCAYLGPPAEDPKHPADLGEANFAEADLRGADLRGADLEGADFAGALLGKTIVDAAQLQRARNVPSDANQHIISADLESQRDCTGLLKSTIGRKPRAASTP